MPGRSVSQCAYCDDLVAEALRDDHGKEFPLRLALVHALRHALAMRNQ